MTKKIIAFLLAAVLLVVAAGCGKSEGSGDGGRSDEQLQEDTYVVLTRLIDRPANLNASKWYDSTIHFSAFIISETFESEIEYDDGDISNDVFQYAIISRMPSSPFLLNVGEMKELPRPGDYVTVTGRPTSFISFEDDDGQSYDELEITMDAFEYLPERVQDVNETESVTFEQDDLQGEMKFIKAHADQMHTPYIALYFEYTNSGEKAAQPPIDRFYISQNDQLLNVDLIQTSGNHIDKEARSLAALSPTEPGETTYSYRPLVPFDDYELTGDPLLIELFNDDFDLIYVYTLPLEDVA